MFLPSKPGGLCPEELGYLRSCLRAAVTLLYGPFFLEPLLHQEGRARQAGVIGKDDHGPGSWGAVILLLWPRGPRRRTTPCPPLGLQRLPLYSRARTLLSSFCGRGLPPHLVSAPLGRRKSAFPCHPGSRHRNELRVSVQHLPEGQLRLLTVSHGAVPGNGGCGVPSNSTKSPQCGRSLPGALPSYLSAVGRCVDVGVKLERGLRSPTSCTGSGGARI